MSNARFRIISAFTIIIIVAVVRQIVRTYVVDYIEIYFRYERIVDAVIALIVGVIVIQLLASAILIWLKRSRESYTVRNIVIVLSYVVLGFIIASLLGLSSEGILASATFSGLVIGLALQPVLTNFFAGLIILFSGFLKPGQVVRVSGSIPVTTLTLPAYKFFSRDYIVPSVKGVVVEIGLIYTKILDTDAQIIKIANSVLLTSVVFEETEEQKTVQIRYEFSIECNPDDILEEINKTLQTMLNDYKIYIEEQSDKQNYTVLIVATTPPSTKAREFRSHVLKEIIKMHRIFLKENKCRQNS